MGVRQLPAHCLLLIDAGRPASEPAAIVERGTLPSSAPSLARSPRSPSERKGEEIRAPSITVVGAVAGLAGQLAWRGAAAA